MSENEDNNVTETPLKQRRSTYTERLNNVEQYKRSNLEHDRKKRMITEGEKVRVSDITKIEGLVHDNGRAISVLLQDKKNLVRLSFMERFSELENKLTKLSKVSMTHKSRRVYSQLESEVAKLLCLDMLLCETTTDTNKVKISQDIFNRSGYSQNLVDAEMLKPDDVKQNLSEVSLRELEQILDDVTPN